MKHRIGIVAMAFALAAPAWAQGVCEAEGTVLDAQGNPVEGVVITFKARGNPANAYTGTTNRKGKYYIAGLYTPKEADRWDITAAKPGYVPTKVRIESRTNSNVLIGDILSSSLKPGTQIPDIVIRPLGKARVDLTLSAEAEVQVQQAQAAEAAAAAATAAAVAAAPQADPYAEALTRAASGDQEGALPLFAKAIETGSEDPLRHEAYAKVLYQLARYAEAEAQAQRAAELGPTRPDPRMILYSIYVAQKDLAKAKSVLQQARELAPKDLRILEQLAYVAQEQGQKGEVIGIYREITTIDPQNAGAWMALGEYYAKSGDPQKSEEAYQKVADLDPGRAYQSFFNLGALIMNRRERSETDVRRAIEAFRKAVGIKPDYAPAHQQLGLALLEIGDRAGAKGALAEYVRLKPQASDAGAMQALIQSLPL